jgi:hypothetical protein
MPKANTRKIFPVIIMISLSILFCGVIWSFNQPLVFIDKVSDYGVRNGFVWGHAEGLSIKILRAHYFVACYIKVGLGWWNKPYWARMLTLLKAFANFKTDITTGGQDQDATSIVVFLMEKGVKPIKMAGEWDLPEQGVARAEIFRSPSLSQTLKLSSAIPIHAGKRLFIDVPKGATTDESALHLPLGSVSLIRSSLSFGTYAVTTRGWLSNMDPNAEAGIFNLNGSDLLILGSGNARFPLDKNCEDGFGCEQFPIAQTEELLTYILEWEPTGMKIRIFSGQWMGQAPPESELLAEWEFVGPTPDPEKSSLGFNIRLQKGQGNLVYGQKEELIIETPWLYLIAP